MADRLASTYDPKEYESKWWKFWTDNKFFNSTPDKSKKPYTILMPPPNITSQLHMGHGTCYTFQDLLIRWKRMCGYNACWLPGTDHAGIATQMMVEKDLYNREKKTRQDLGREEFLKLLWNWRNKFGGMIIKQFEKIGFSADYSKLSFTMDESLSRAVRYVFVTLFNEGLIYRGERLVNWDPVLKTAISDDEIKNEPQSGKLWYIRYPVKGEDRYVVVATTRPETILGDTAVAVSPDDDRYRDLVGKTLVVPLMGREIKLITDSYVEKEFGTGAVKITPAHDFNDFEVGKRNNLEFINIFNDDATLNENTPEDLRGLDRFVARKKILEKLKELNLLEKEENYKNTVPISDRSKAIVEPKLSKQWFVKMKDLARPAIDAYKNGKIHFYPASFSKTYLYWLENIKDWCISRQLWWGHRIPIWYCKDCGEVTTGFSDPTSCCKCGSSNIYQDEDVLDTWFSSWLWPLSPFGWPSESSKEAIDYYYPTDVLLTAPEILFLWVSRMIMLGLKFKGEVPFRDMYFSATVCDKQGRKFSKTLGNGIDPLKVIDRHGADAVRFTGISLAPLGARIKMDESDFDLGAKFINKLWNASRFILHYVSDDFVPESITKIEQRLDLSSKWLIEEFRQTSARINEFLSSYRLNDAVAQIYHFIWGSLCDWSIECSKKILNGSDIQKKNDSLSVLIYVLDGALRLASPAIPFVTEEIWQKLPAHPDWGKRESSLVISSYPTGNEFASLDFADAHTRWQEVMNLISLVRSARQQLEISPKENLSLSIKAKSKDLAITFETEKASISQLCNVTIDKIDTVDIPRPQKSIVQVSKSFECFIICPNLDFDKEKQRIQNEIKRITPILKGIEAKLSNPNFASRAPREVVEQTEAQRDNLSTQLKVLNDNLKSFI